MLEAGHVGKPLVGERRLPSSGNDITHRILPICVLDMNFWISEVNFELYLSIGRGR